MDLPPAERRRRWTACEPVLRALEAGATLRKAARESPVHVATVCRWRAADEDLDAAFARALQAGRDLRAGREDFRILVRTSDKCPECGADLQVRTARGLIRFWRCPCGFQSWRQRVAFSCGCGGPVFLARSGKSIACARCGARRALPRETDEARLEIRRAMARCRASDREIAADRARGK